MTNLILNQLVIGRPSFRAGPFDLSVAQGATVALIGPNGSGKTSLLHTIAGLLQPLAGAVSGPSPTAALLPAAGTLSAAFSSRHMVALGRSAARGAWAASLGKADRAAADAALSALGITALADRPFDTLSSGQQQLVLMARVRVQPTSLCLLDEPTAMLDPVQSEKVWLAARRLARDGRIIVAATHDLDWAVRADTVVGIDADGVFVSPGASLDIDRLSSLYGRPMQACGTCGRISVAPLASV